MNVEPSPSDERTSMFMAMVAARNVTEGELQESVSPESDMRLKNRLKLQAEMIERSRNPKAWDW